MADISKMTKAKSDQWNGDDLIGGSMVIRITKTVEYNNPQQPLGIFFEGDLGKAYKPNLTFRRVLEYAWGKDTESYVGKHMIIFREPNVVYGGETVGGIEISHMEGIDPKKFPAYFNKSKGKKKPVTVKLLTPEMIGNKPKPQREPEPVNQTVTPSELSVDERVEVFAAEFTERFKHNGFEEFDTWWNKSADIKKIVPDWRLDKMSNAIAAKIEKGWP